MKARSLPERQISEDALKQLIKDVYRRQLNMDRDAFDDWMQRMFDELALAVGFYIAHSHNPLKMAARFIDRIALVVDTVDKQRKRRMQ